MKNKLQTIGLIVMLCIILTRLNAQCNCQTYTKDESVFKICTPKPMIGENHKDFQQLFLGYSTADKQKSISLTLVFTKSQYIVSGNLKLILSNGELIEVVKLNSYLDNDEEVGVICLSNFMIRNLDIDKLRSFTIKHISFKLSDGLNYMINPIANRDIIKTQLNCL